MQSLDVETYLKLREGSEVVEADSHGDKVLLAPDGTYLKLFRRKRLLSSALVWPYARRFADNVKALQAKDIPCPTIIAVYRIPGIERDAVHYTPLAGQTLRQLIKQGQGSQLLRRNLARFVADLHAHGIYFRSLHLGNVVLTPGNELGLIDIADLKCQSRPLSKSQRIRNFQHMLRYDSDKQWLFSDSMNQNDFFGQYLKHSHWQMELAAFVKKVEQH
jgi:tRNA A-37 threonylcarbamoyl transferase component Bud32